jgi:hypothetical protein
MMLFRNSYSLACVAEPTGAMTAAAGPVPVRSAVPWYVPGSDAFNSCRVPGDAFEIG